MSMDADALANDSAIMHLLQPGERVELRLDTPSADLRVTDRRILVTNEDFVRLDIPYGGLRRVQFDIEAGRPATLVLVPHVPTDEPQVMSVPVHSLHHAGEVLAFIGERLG
jgi:hypothetical protein